MVARFFRDLTQKQIRRGCFANVTQLIETIEAYIAQHNTTRSPSFGPPKASDILEKVNAPGPPVISYDLFDALH